jgi:hypothetical protein
VKNDSKENTDNEKLIGYKVMRIQDGKICSLASNTHKFPATINKSITMDGKGIWLSTNKDFVIDYYSNPDENNEVLITLEFKSSDITSGCKDDKEPVLTVPKAVVKNIQSIVDSKIIDLDQKKLFPLSKKRKISPR